MTHNKAKGVRGASGRPYTPSSHMRLRVDRLRGESTGVRSVSSLPPPPFQSEADVPALHEWLDAHMSLASELLWLSQHIEAADTGVDLPGEAHSAGERGAHLNTLRGLMAQVEGVRDALWELYYDAADPRMAALVRAGAPLEAQVVRSYAWASRVVALLTVTTNSVLVARGPDWSTAKAGFRLLAGSYPKPEDVLQAAVSALPVDFGSPVEPLRNFPRNLGQLLAAADELQASLLKRFG